MKIAPMSLQPFTAITLKEDGMRLMRYLIAFVTIVVAGSLFGQVEGPGTCDGCQPGEYRAVAAWVVGPGDYVYETDPSCGDGMDNALDELISAYGDSQIPGVSTYAGPLIGAVASQLGQAIKQNIQGSLGQALAPWTNPTANCVMITIAIPKGSQYLGYRLEAKEEGESQWHKCAVNGGCLEGWCRFAQEPYVNWTRSGGVLATTFKNWASDRTRYARMSVYFKPPSNTWAPPR